MKTLKTGVAYHGNRMPSHAKDDLLEIANADMDIVVHMLSHMDWERHGKAMKEIFKMSDDLGLDVWVDNWGIGGYPGDVSHFLCKHPDAHMIYGNGEMHPYQVCLNSPEYRQFVKDWLDAVVELGGKTIFWDEPQLPFASFDGKMEYCCTCPRCKKKFEERYNKPLTDKLTSDLDGEFAEFRTDSIVEYFKEITEYSTSLGLYNAACVMPGKEHGIGLDSVGKLLSLPTIDNVGYDPYWFNVPGSNAYEYVYNGTREAIERSDAYGKGHNIWIQGYNAAKGREEEIVEATEAAYDAGARCILSWSFHSGESNNYHSEDTVRSWNMTVEGMKRVKSRERDRIWEENRKKFQR